MDDGSQFRLSLAKNRRWLIGLAFVCVFLGLMRDRYADVAFPSVWTFGGTAAILVFFQLRFSFRGVRALNISSGGISVEQAFGGKTLRFTWLDLKAVEVLRSQRGPIWVFSTRSGGKFRWLQVGYDGDQRIELARSLISALQNHHVRIR